MPIRRFCSKCGKQLSTKNLRRSATGLCLICFDRARAKGPHVSCTLCNKNIYLNPRAQKRKHHFCSFTCYATWKKQQAPRAFFTCIECGQTFERFKSLGSYKFCSYKCNWIWVSKNRRGKNHHAYIDGRTPFRSTLYNSAQHDQWK